MTNNRNCNRRPVENNLNQSKLAPGSSKGHSASTKFNLKFEISLFPINCLKILLIKLLLVIFCSNYGAKRKREGAGKFVQELMMY